MDDVSVSAVVEIPPVAEWAPTRANVMFETMARATSPIKRSVSMDLSVKKTTPAASVSMPDLSEIKKTTPKESLVAVSTELLHNLRTTTAYQMFGVKEPVAVEGVDPATLHANTLHAHMPDGLNPVYDLVSRAMCCMESWANRVYAHRTAALDMVASMWTLIEMRLDQSRSDCAPLLLALASTFEMLKVFASPG